ncbi:MAG: DUF4340 domain-containing protein [Alphaproteobacteria bacterium]|jgi:hypothetical protein|tara:strand:- start:14710 stop:15720 length:1011 start_codon:yes stop_codon:yes gene_type:complete
MSPRFFGVLSIIAIFLIIISGVTSSISSRWVKDDVYGALYFADLSKKLDDVSEIKIRQSGKSTILKKEDNSWLLTENDNFEANIKKVKDNLLAIANMTKVEAKTKRPDLFNRLRLEDPDSPESKSYLLELLDSNNYSIFSVVIGKTRPNVLAKGRNGVYIRDVGDNQTWLVHSDLKISDGLADWIDTRLFDIQVEDLTKLQVKRGVRTPLTFGRSASNDNVIELQDFDLKAETRTSIGLQSVVTRLLWVDFDDIRKDELQDKRLLDTTVEIITNNDDVILLSLYNDLDEGAWVTFENETTKESLLGRVGFQFHLDKLNKEEFIITLNEVLKIEKEN